MRLDQQTYLRARNAALLGLGVQLALALGLLVMGLWQKSPALFGTSLYAFGGLMLWACLWIVYQQHRPERLEALETEQLAARHGSDSSIFETSAEDLAVARRRLERLHRWALPITSLLIAGYLIGLGAWMFLRNSVLLRLLELPTGTNPTIEQQNVIADLGGAEAQVKDIPHLIGLAPADPGMMVWVAGGLAFGIFIISRYLAGMAKTPHWQLLRGGAGYLMGNALVCALLAIAYFIFNYFEQSGFLRYMSLVVPACMVILGVEIALNLLLDIYRPRQAGEAPRAAFDSRLLSLLTTPESIAKTINEAINYQFGFEITRSWFYQLLARSLGGLVVFAVIVLLGLSCIIIVEPHQQAAVTRFGKLVSDPALGPGLHLKWPWPVSSAQLYDVTGLRELRVASEKKLKPGMPILWTNEHTEGLPINLIAAQPAGARTDQPPDEAEPSGAAAPSVSLVNAEVFVHYRIKDLIDYVSASRSPDEQLRAIGQRLPSLWVQGRDIDALIGVARTTGSVELQRVIQRAADEASLGLEVVNISVASVHPPKDVADAFHEVVGAEQEKQQKIEVARQLAIRTMVEVAGTRQQAVQIVELIETYDGLRNPEQSEIDGIERDIERLVLAAGGRAAQLVADARAYRWQRESNERAEADRFGKQLLAYRQAPRVYRARNLLNVLSQGMASARKYVVLADHEDMVIRMDLKDTLNRLENIMDQALQAEEDEEKKKKSK